MNAEGLRYGLKYSQTRLAFATKSVLIGNGLASTVREGGRTFEKKKGHFQGGRGVSKTPPKRWHVSCVWVSSSKLDLQRKVTLFAKVPSR